MRDRLEARHAKATVQILLCCSLFSQTTCSSQQKISRWQPSLGGKHQCELACHKQLYWTEVPLYSKITSPEAKTVSDGEQRQNHSKAQVPELKQHFHGGQTGAMQPPVQPCSHYSSDSLGSGTSGLRLHVHVIMLVWWISNNPRYKHKDPRHF